MGTTGQSVTLANSIIGVGILAMPFCFQQCGVLLATLILVSMGLLSRLCCYFLLKSALLARRRNFEFLAFHVFGSAGKMAVEVGIIGFLMGTCIAYFVVVGDLGPQIIAKMFNINQSDILRTSIMVIVSLVCVLPLGLLRNVDSLSNVSAATIGFYFCLVLKVIEEATSQLLSDNWHTRIEMWKPAGVLQCVPIFSMALFCQTQLFEIFESLPTLSLEKMNVVTKNAINICTTVYFTLGVFGYIAFGSKNISGNILMSLSPTMASDVIKLGFVMSLAFSFPLIIFPCRASLYSFLYKKVHSSHHDHIINNSIPESSFRCITVAIIAVTLFISLLLPNIELVLGLVGSTIGILICMVFPAACFVNITFKNTNERILAKAVLVLGLIIMVLGTYANLQAAETRPDRYDENITKERIDKIVEDFFEKMEKNEGKNEVIQNTKNIADSEIQPPNPIPPESQSNEKNPIIKQEKDKENIERIRIEQENKDANDKADKVSESHPRNLKNKLLNEAKITIDESIIQNGKSVNSKEIVENRNEEKLKDEKVKTPSTQEKVQQKIDLLKQQQLIETIKQHGEEQKELIKEQKEILDELKKTKNELQQNKKEIDNVEAKKIAVESIQKIANMAIKSLSGVTDPPAALGEKEKKFEPLEKIANEAVVEIAKKAVESIEAIKEKEQAKPDHVEIANAQPVNVVNPAPLQNIVSNQKVEPVQNLKNQANVIPAVPVNQEVKVDNVPAANPSANVVNPKPNAPPLVSNVDAIKPQETIVQNVNAAPNVNGVAFKQEDSIQNVNPAVNAAIIKPQNVLPNSNPVPNGVAFKQEDSIQHVNPALNAAVIKQQNVLPNVNPAPENIIPKPVQNINSGNQQVPKLNQEENPKVHSHSPDEPQSYKQGEDLQGRNEKDHLNVPLPIAINGNSQNNKIEHNIAKTVLKTDDVQNVNNNLNVNAVQNNGAKDTSNNLHNDIANANVPARQKREVVYCTEKMLLKPEDKAICKTLIGLQDNKIPQDILSSKVDLNDLLPKSLPVDMIHHIRSLKSYDENEKKR